MKLDMVLEYFKSKEAIREALGLSSTGSVSQWKEIIPEKQAMRLERITGGKLVYDESLYEKK